MNDRLRSILWLGVLLGALLACKKKSAPDPAPTVYTEPEHLKRFKELTPKVKALLGKLPEMSQKAKTEPAVKSEQPLKTKLEKTKFVTIGDKWLLDVHRDPSDGELDLDDTKLSLCAYAVEKQGESLKDSDIKDNVRYMEECLAWEYIAVVRPKKVTMPKIMMATKTFEPGEVSGDLLLFAMPAGEIKARYRFRTTNSDELKWFEGKPEKEWSDESKRDLVENLKGVIEERFALERDSMGK
ncbi:MAG: hypothetical protein IPM35_15640 [Myxococcales bacterium]|nr:hypothetical protein [Myxococcales bacterium]